MFKTTIGNVLAGSALVALLGMGWSVSAAAEGDASEKAKPAAASEEKSDASKKEDAPKEEKAAGGNADAPLGSMTAYERVKATEPGTLKNPYTGDKTAEEEGKKLYLSNSCNGCHGGTGGGGMCPPLTNQVWIYGADDDTLFRLITLGTKELGRKRVRTESVKGPMPPYKDIITDEKDLWKIIAWIRTTWKHGDKGKTW